MFKVIELNRVCQAKNYLIKINVLGVFFLFLVASILPNSLTLFFPDIFTNKTVENFTGYSFVTVFVMVVIILPFIETVIFQTAIISIVCKLIKSRKYSFFVAVFISSVLFALHHSHGIAYLLLGFYAGGVMSVAYFVAKERGIQPTLFVLSIHSIYNLLVLIVNLHFA